jgi:hypothetical protein
MRLLAPNARKATATLSCAGPSPGFGYKKLRFVGQKAAWPCALYNQ